MASKKKASELKEARRGAELAQHRQEVRGFVCFYGSGVSGGVGAGGGVGMWELY